LCEFFPSFTGIGCNVFEVKKTVKLNRILSFRGVATPRCIEFGGLVFEVFALARAAFLLEELQVVKMALC